MARPFTACATRRMRAPPFAIVARRVRRAHARVGPRGSYDPTRRARACPCGCRRRASRATRAELARVRVDAELARVHAAADAAPRAEQVAQVDDRRRGRARWRRRACVWRHQDPRARWRSGSFSASCPRPPGPRPRNDHPSENSRRAAQALRSYTPQAPPQEVPPVAGRASGADGGQDPRADRAQRARLEHEVCGELELQQRWRAITAARSASRARLGQVTAATSQPLCLARVARARRRPGASLHRTCTDAGSWLCSSSTLAVIRARRSRCQDWSGRCWERHHDGGSQRRRSARDRYEARGTAARSSSHRHPPRSEPGAAAAARGSLGR